MCVCGGSGESLGFAMTMAALSVSPSVILVYVHVCAYVAHVVAKLVQPSAHLRQ